MRRELALLLLDGIAKSRPWFAGFEAEAEPDQGSALAEVLSALDRLRDVVSKNGGAAASAHHTVVDPMVSEVHAACEARIAEARSEQTSRRRELRSLRAAFIRTRRRRLRRLYVGDPAEATTYDVVRSERVDGRVAQRFVIGLGTVKKGGSESGDAERRAHFLELALRDLLRAGFAPELEGKLLRELARKAAVVPPDLERCRAWLRGIHAHRGWPVDDQLERFDRLELVMQSAQAAA